VSAFGAAKPLVDEAITTISYVCPGAPMLFYRAVLPLSRATLVYAAGVIRRHPARPGPDLGAARQPRTHRSEAHRANWVAWAAWAACGHITLTWQRRHRRPADACSGTNRACKPWSLAGRQWPASRSLCQPTVHHCRQPMIHGWPRLRARSAS